MVFDRGRDCAYYGQPWIPSMIPHTVCKISDRRPGSFGINTCQRQDHYQLLQKSHFHLHLWHVFLLFRRKLCWMLFRGCLSSEPAFPLFPPPWFHLLPLTTVPLIIEQVLSAFNKIDQEPLFLGGRPLQGSCSNPPRLLACCITVCSVWWCQESGPSSSPGDSELQHPTSLQTLLGEKGTSGQKLCGARVRGERRGPELKRDTCGLRPTD